jgi:TatA/E family protein of Tat protein translocase
MQGIFGVGPLEVLFVLVLVLLVFGPERLPELTRNLGNAIRRLKETYVAFVNEFRDELTPIANEIDAVTRDLRKDLAEIRDAADIRGLIPSISADDIGAVQSVAATPAAISTTPVPAVAEVENKILPPTASQINTNGHSANHNGKHTTPRTAHAKVNLPDDNPWASLGAPIRSDQLDDDNPWRN